jgi:uncharacterized cupin superfamily protein
MVRKSIRNLDEIEAVSTATGEKFALTRKRLAAPTGGKEIGCSWFEVPPGKTAFPHHAHFGNEEAFFILSGKGICRIGDERFEVSAGDYIACPAGEETSHSLQNTGEENLRYLGISTAHGTDVIVYPDSQKIAVIGGADMHKGLKSAPLSKMFKDPVNVDYYLDE